jgi:hypothetical protein
MAKEDNLLKGHKPTQFTSEKQPANAGRPPSFKNAYKEILGEAGSVIWVDENKLLERTTAEGVKQVGLQLNKVQTLLSRLDRMATGKNEKLSFEVIRFLWEQMDGKATQPVDANVTQKIIDWTE